MTPSPAPHRASTLKRNRRTSSVLPPGGLDDPRDLRADLPAHRLVFVLHHYPDHRLRPARPEQNAPLIPEPLLGPGDCPLDPVERGHGLRGGSPAHGDV